MMADFIDLMAKNKPREAGKSFAEALKKQRLDNLMTHKSYQSPYQQFQAEYPKLDAYGRKVASGGFLRENVDRWNAAMENSKAQAFEGAQDTGEGNIMDYFAPMAMTAYHGSPHLFDKFSMDKIGTGEGAQAYGYGLYFAEDQKVAGYYQKKLANYDFDRMQTDPVYSAAVNVDSNMGDVEKTKEIIRQKITNNPDLKPMVEKARKVLEALETGEYKNIEFPKGSLYEVDIPDEHVKNFLDWDAPLSEQPEILEKLKGTDFIEEAQEFIDDADIYDGNTLYNRIADYYGDVMGTQKEASDLLNTLGIKGIKYFDGSSRKAGEGTRNLVVFDDSIVKTLKRNGEDILPENLKRQSGLAEQDYRQTNKTPEMLKKQSD